MSDLNQDIENMRRDRSLLLAEAEAAGAIRKGRAWSCWHGDKHPSAGPYAKDGIERFKCHGCGFNGDVFDIRAHRTGRSRSDLIREEIAAMKPPPQAEPAPDFLTIAQRAYKAITGDQLAALGESLGLSVEALRQLRVGWIDAATIRENRTDSRGCEGAWSWPMRDEHRVIIGIRLRFPDGSKGAITGSRSGLFIPAGLPGGSLVIVEGPTDTAAMIDLGFAVIGRPSNASGGEFIMAFCQREPRDVAIIHQNDKAESVAKEQTEKAAASLAESLTAICPSVRVLHPPADRKDCRDWLKAGAVTADVDARISAADSHSASNLLRDRFTAICDGRYEAIGWPWPLLSRGTQALTPGSITIIAGDPGSTKSFMALQCLAYWLDQGIRADVLMLEKDRTFHVMRALSQRSGVASLTDVKWVKANPEQVADLLHEHRAFIDDMGRRIHDTSETGARLADVTKWVERMAAAGSRIIIVDPITLADAGRERWLEDSALMRNLGRILTEHGSSIILTTHPPKKPQGSVSLDHLAGGSAYARAADCVLYLVKHDEAVSKTIKGGSGGDGDMSSVLPFLRSESVNREVIILKARESRGSGWHVGFNFESESLTFTEVGLTLKTKKRKHDQEEVA